MSTNFVSYENAEDIFQGYADRIKANTEFVGTQAEWDALSAEDKAKYVLVNITDDNNSTGGEKEVINGYYNSADGKFYIDSSYTTEIVPDSACIYVDLNENKMYRYDSLESEYVIMSGGGGKVYVGGYGINVDNTTDEISAKTFVGTQAEWNALSPEAQEEFDSVNITDDATLIDYEPGHAIVDSTGTEAPQRNNLKFDGMTVTDDSTNDTTVVAPIPYTAGDNIVIDDHEISVDEKVTTTFTGTRAEWEALSAAEKAAYTIVNLTDDPAGSGMVVVDVIADGNMNAVTSNAVYDSIHTDVILVAAADRINLKSYKGTTLVNGYKVQHDGYIRLWFDSSVASANLKVTVGLSSIRDVQVYYDYTGEPGFNAYSNHVLFVRKGLYVFYNCNPAVTALDTSKWVIEFCPLFDAN